jgi:hypothetical protein
LLFSKAGILAANSGTRNAAREIEQFRPRHELFREAHPPGDVDLVLVEAFDQVRRWMHTEKYIMANRGRHLDEKDFAVIELDQLAGS